MPIGSTNVYNPGDLILSTVSGSGTSFTETKIIATTSSLILFNSNGTLTSASLNSTTVGTASYVSGNTSIITNITASNISASGIIRTTQLTASSILASNGPLMITGSNAYLQMFPVGGDPLPANLTASYIYTSGSTNDMYFTQYNGPYTNTTRLRWLESNLYTGILHGGVLTSTPGSTTFAVSAGEGIIVSMNAFTASAPYPTVKIVSWPTSTQSIINSGSAKITYVGINDVGGIVQQTNAWGSTDINQWDTQIALGVVLHLSGSVSNGVFNSPQISYGSPQQADDFFRAFGPLKISGHVLQASGSSPTLSIKKTGGTAYREGVNYLANPNHPSTAVENAINTSKIYRYYVSGSTPVIDTGVANAGYTTIDNDKYVNTTTGQLATVGNSTWTIQRVFWIPNSPTNAFIVYYGNASYSTLLNAVNAKDSEPFTESPNTALNAIFVGYIIIEGGAGRDLLNAAECTIIQGGLFRNVGGIGSSGTAPVSTTLAGLSDVDLVGLSAGDLLVYGGGQWNNNKTLTGNYTITGSLTVQSGITGNLTGTSSLASNARTASYLTPSNSYTITSLTASTISASGAIIASSFTGSFSGSIGTAVNATSASYALTSSYISPSGNAFVQGGNSFGTTALLGTNDAQPLALETNGTTRMTINSNGNVGIGTTVPTGSLHIQNSVANVPILNLGGGVAFNNVSDLYVLNSYNTASGVGFAAKVIGVNISGSLTNGNIPVQRTVWSGVTSATAMVLSSDDPGSGNQDNAFQIWTSNDGVAGTELTQKFSLSSTGDVGIGTTSLGEKLTVSGSSYIIGGTGAVGTGTAYYLGNSSNKDISLTRVDAATLAIGRYYPSAWAETIRFTADGNVGIGTSNPTVRLHVIGSSIITNPSPSANSAVLLVQDDGTATTVTSGTTLRVVNDGSSANYSVFEVSSAVSDFVILNNGNVGIGTTVPVARLAVNPSGSAFDSTNVMVAYFGKRTANGYGSTFIRVAPRNNITTTGSAAGSTEYTDIENNSGGAGPFRYGTYGDTNIINGNSYTAGIYGNINFVTSGSTRMTIAGGTAAGNVGIGTTSPTARLHVSGSTGGVFEVDTVGGTTAFYVSASGNVGIGTPNPLGRLHITASATNGESLVYLSKGSGSISQNYINAVDQSGNLNYRVQSDINGHLGEVLYQTGTSYVSLNTFWSSWINNNNYTQGGLGIGTTSQTHGYGVTIARPATSGSLYVSGSSVFTGSVSIRDNVGIGTTSTSDKLSVISGSTRIASSALAGVIYLGNDTSNIYLQRDNNYDLSLVQNGDSNSALYLASAGNVYINIDSNNNDTDKAFIVQNNALKAGTELFRIQENGNIGIGTTVPLAITDIQGTNVTLYAANYVGSVGTIYLRGNDAYNSGTAGAGIYLRGKYDSSSNVTTFGAISAIKENDIDGNYAGALTFLSRTNGQGSGAAEKMRIDSNGNVGIGTSSPIAKLDVSGSSRFGVTSTNTHQFSGSVSVSNNITCLSLTETSTEAVKYNIIPLPSQLENVLKLTPVSFNYKTNDKHSIGLIAEEVAKIYPEFTSDNNDSISYGKITSVLIQSIKELKTIIDNQQKQIEDLVNKLK